MGRKIAVAAAAFALALVSAATAGAKVMSLRQVRVTGPGIDGTLLVSPDEFGRIKSGASPSAIVLDAFHVPIPRDPQPSGPLGPRFLITYVEEFFVNRGEIVQLKAHLYPYAEGGPVAFVLPDQRLDPFESRRRARPGWVAYPQPLVENLREAGLPGPQAAERALGTDPATALPWGLAGVALAMLLWGLGSLRTDRGAVTLGRT